MNKGKVVRLAGFVGALGLSTVLVTTAIQGTGAWFTDSSAGGLTASSGSLSLLTQWPGQQTLSQQATGGTLAFSKLMPGANETENVAYQANASSGNVDLWLVFTPGVEYERFTGGKNASTSPRVGYLGTDGGMGGYGFFSVSDSVAGTAFTSGNLAFPDGSRSDDTATGTYDATENGCSTTENGRVGSSAVITDAMLQADPHATVPWCGVPQKILLRSGIANHNGGTGSITFGLNGPKQTQQNQQEFGTDDNHAGTVPFKLVATQAGQRP